MVNNYGYDIRLQLIIYIMLRFNQITSSVCLRHFKITTNNNTHFVFLSWSYVKKTVKVNYFAFWIYSLLVGYGNLKVIGCVSTSSYQFLPSIFLVNEHALFEIRWSNEICHRPARINRSSAEFIIRSTFSSFENSPPVPYSFWFALWV